MKEGAGAPLLILTQDEVQDSTLRDMLDKKGISNIMFDPGITAAQENNLDELLESEDIQVVLANRQLFQ